jgi:hypothetical protein
LPTSSTARTSSTWCEQVNARRHRTLRCRPLDRLAEERQALRALPARPPDCDRRLFTRAPQDPHIRLDRNDYLLDPQLVGERVEIRATQREVVAVALRTGELCAHHRRVFAGGLTITDPTHQHALEHLRGERRGARREPEVELRSLARYDALIPA